MAKKLMASRESEGGAKGRRSKIIATELGYLWSNMLQRGVLETHRTIGFCAIGEGEGSNTMAANMALFLGSKGNRVVLVPRTRMSGRVQVSVAGELRSTHGTSLGEAWASQLDLPEAEPGLRFVGQGTILPSGDSLLLPIESRNLRGLVVSAIRVPQDNLPQFLQVNQLDGQSELYRVGRRVWWQEFALPDPGERRQEWTRHVLDLAPLARRFPRGLYHLEAFFLPGHSLYSCAGMIPEPVLPGPLAHGENDQDYRAFLDARRNVAVQQGWSHSDDPCADDFFWSWWDDEPTRVTGRNVLVSNLGLLASSQEDGSLLVGVSDLQTGRPVPDARVELWSKDLLRLASASLDAQGFARLANPDAGLPISWRDASPLLVAVRGDDRIFMKLDAASRLSLSGFDTDGVGAEHGLKAWITGERGVWRPGDSLFVSCMVQDPQHTLPAGHPLELELRTPLGTRYLSSRQNMAASGLNVFRLATAPDAPTGHWEAVLKLGGREVRQLLRIESVRPNRLAVDLELEGPLLAGRKLTGNLDVHWLHGAPAAGLKADLSLSLREDPRPFPGWTEFSFRDPTRSFQPAEFRLTEGRLDGAGHWRLVLDPLPLDARPPGRLSAVFTARAFEEAGVFSQRNQVLPAHAWPRYLGMKLPEPNAWGFHATDRPTRVRLQALDLEGQPTGPVPVELSLYAIDRHWWWEEGADNIGRYLTREGIEPVRRDTLTLSARGADWELMVPEHDWGRYLLLARDIQGGHRCGQFLFFDSPEIEGSRGGDTAESLSQLALSPDREVYQTGQTAIIQVPTARGAQVLVSLEKGGRVLRRYRQAAGAGSTRLEIPLLPEHSPTLYLHVTVLQPWRNSANDLPLRLTGMLPLTVENPDTRLHPVLKTPAEFLPGQEARITLSERDGLACDMTLAIVDEGLLDLTNSDTPDPWSHFYGKEALAVVHYDNYSRVSGALAGRMESVLALGGDGWEAPPETRVNRFPPMVRFIGPIRFKAGETRQLQVPFPEYMGSVKVMAVAKAGDACGSSGVAVPVRGPLMVLGALPRVIGLKEECSLPVSVFVGDEVTGPITLSVRAEGGLQLDGPASKQLAAGSGERRESFQLKSASLPGSGRVILEARSGDLVARQRIELALRHPGGRERDTVDKLLEPGEELQLDWPGNGLPGTSRGRLELSLGPPLHLGERLEGLLGYPHGCLEQIVSQAMPLLALEGLGQLPDSLQERRGLWLRATIERLQRLQRPEGGFGMWPGRSRMDDWANSWAGHFMLLAEKQGYALPAGMKANWVLWQSRRASAWTTGDAASQMTQAYRLYTLALAGSADLGAMNRLRERQDLPAACRWRLAAAYRLAGHEDGAQALSQGLPLAGSDASIADVAYGASLRDRAMVLDACVMLERREDVNRLSRELAGELGTGQHSTQSLGWALHSLAEATRLLAEGGGIRAELGQSGRTRKLETARPLLELPVTLGGTNADQVLRNTSSTPLHVVFTRSWLPEPGTGTALSHGLNLTLELVDDQGQSILADGLRQGTDVVLRATVSNPGNRPLKDLALTLSLPSGWEPRDPARELIGVEYQDRRDDRVISYFNLAAHARVGIEVRAHAAFPGRYLMPAQRVEALYDSDVQAVVPGDWVRVLSSGSARP